RTVRPEVPVLLEQIVMRALEKPREQRFRDAAELRAALGPFAQRSMPPGRLVPKWSEVPQEPLQGPLATPPVHGSPTSYVSTTPTLLSPGAVGLELGLPPAPSIQAQKAPSRVQVPPRSRARPLSMIGACAAAALLLAMTTVAWRWALR